MTADARLRVVQLNCASVFEPGWEQRRHEIVAWIDELQPDVVCLEEVGESPKQPNTAGWIADNASGTWHWRFGGSELGERVQRPKQQFGSAILSRWPIDTFTYERLPLGPRPDLWLLSFPFEVVHASTAGLDIFAAHLAAAPSQGLHRREQVRHIDSFIRDVREPADAMGSARSPMPAILCGDFNAEPDSDEIRFLCGFTAFDDETTFWQDAWRVAGDGSPGYTQDWRDNEIAASMNVHRKRIDYVFVGDPFFRPDGGGRVLAAELAFHESRTGVMASDHRGLVVDVAWPTRPAED